VHFVRKGRNAASRLISFCCRVRAYLLLWLAPRGTCSKQPCRVYVAFIGPPKMPRGDLFSGGGLGIPTQVPRPCLCVVFLGLAARTCGSVPVGLTCPQFPFHFEHTTEFLCSLYGLSGMGEREGQGDLVAQHRRNVCFRQACVTKNSTLLAGLGLDGHMNKIPRTWAVLHRRLPVRAPEATS
jgi:hypothetical protein